MVLRPETDRHIEAALDEPRGGLATMAPKQQRGTVAWGSSKRGASPSAPKAAPKAGGDYRPRNRLTTMFSRDKSRVSANDALKRNQHLFK